MIKVVKPRKLGKKYQFSKDVFNNKVDLDSICIFFGGKYGIPPQLIKAHFEKESEFEDYGGDIGKSFAPSFRYEPFEDIKYQKGFWSRYFGSEKHYVVDSTTMGTGKAIPIKHANVKPILYPTTPAKIKDYLADNILFYLQRKNQRVISSGNLTKIFQEYIKKSKSTNVAIDSLKEYLRNGNAGNDFNKIAQTRIMSSYGLLQLTFYNTTDLNLGEFSKTNADIPPEYLNEAQYFFPAYIERQYKKLMKLVLKIDQVPSSSWSGGFDNAWKKTLQLHNPLEGKYGDIVYKFSKKYLPTK